MKKAFSSYSYEQDDYIRIYRSVERLEMQKQLEVNIRFGTVQEIVEILHLESPTVSVQNSNVTKIPALISSCVL